MYAIRSYYVTLPLATGGIDLSRVEFLEFWVWEDNERSARANRAGMLIDVGGVRITSYNVCYTKLLRVRHDDPGG